jgi:hypothetical protein
VNEKNILVRRDMTFTCRDLGRFTRSWIQQTSELRMHHCHASIFTCGIHKHASFLETVLSEMCGSHRTVAVDMSLCARRMTSVSALIFSLKIVLFKHNNDSACQTVHHLTS